jgi:hypothetical protein
MNTFTETSPALVDANVRTYIAQITAGEITETEGRWKIAGALLSLRIPEYVADRTPNIDFQTKQDLVQKLQGIIEDKAIDESFLDLATLNTKSASGWARQLAKSAVKFSLKKIIHDRLREMAVDPIIDTTDTPSASSYEALSFHSASTDVDFDPEGDITESEMDDIREEFEAAALGTRPSLRLGLSARAALKAYKLPAAIRPDSMIDREWVREAITKNDQLAYLSLSSYDTFIGAAENEEQRQVDDRLWALWDDYTADDRALLLEKTPLAAQWIVLAAIAPRARPNRDVIALSLHTLRMATTDDDVRSYQKFTRDLLNAWIASECSAVSEFDTKGTLSDEKAAERMIAAMNWPELAAEAAARKGQPFGADADEVERFIAGIVDTLSA